MKNLTIALSLILSLGLFGCHDKDYSPTSFNETGSVTTDDPFISVCGGVSFEDGVTEDSGDVFCTYPDDPPGPNPPGPNPPTPRPVTTEQPPTYTSPPVCRSVSPWDEVTEDSGDVFCTEPPSPTIPTPLAPIIGCTGTVTSQTQLDSIRDCVVLLGSIYLQYSPVTVISLPLLEQVTGKVFLRGNGRLTKILLPALTSVDTTIEIDHNEVLTEISLPVLNTVGDRLYITDNDALTDISLPLLTIVGGKIRISYNDELTDVSIPTLTSVDNDENDSAYISFNNSLQICDLGSYTDQYCP